MTIALNTSADGRHVSNLETVRLYTAAGVAAGTVSGAKRIGQTKRERAPSEGQYVGTAVDWRLPAVGVAQEVQPGWRIVGSDGLAFIVLAVDHPGRHNGVYRCACIALRVMGHAITWKLPTKVPDLYGSPILDQSASIASGPCAIQEVACEEVLFQGVSSGFRRTFHIWVLFDVVLQAGTIGVDENGSIYAVQAVQTRNRLDELLCIVATQEPG